MGAQNARDRTNEQEAAQASSDEEQKRSSQDECSSGEESGDSDQLQTAVDTPNEPLAEMKLYMWYFDQCDPKKCSGMNLKKIGLLRTIALKAKFNGLVLTPATDKMISLEDAGILMEHGVAVIDCSWAFFDSVKVRSIR
mmetsp:Transcript_682/g.1055  ORF Transcript_682/g.1055 Transcript_682/m.1055 type:complete len:139 (+) Transcript_682:68-484(+)